LKSSNKIAPRLLPRNLHNSSKSGFHSFQNNHQILQTYHLSRKYRCAINVPTRSKCVDHWLVSTDCI
jgi:hypothetical protein